MHIGCIHSIKGEHQNAMNIYEQCLDLVGNDQSDLQRVKFKKSILITTIKEMFIANQPLEPIQEMLSELEKICKLLDQSLNWSTIFDVYSRFIKARILKIYCLSETT
jgi:hypothetical protein